MRSVGLGLAMMLVACGGPMGVDGGAEGDGGPEADAAASADGGPDAGAPIDGGDPTVAWFDPPAAPMPPAIDWLDDGAPPVAAPVIDWLPDGRPPVALPVMTPCPTGWGEILVDGVTACDPYPSDVAACGPGQAHFPGGAGCEEVGDACPAAGDLYSPTLPTDGTPILYVAAGGTGTGTLAAPFGSVQAAMDAATPGTTIAIGVGTFAEELTVRDGVTLHGACASRTVLRPPPPASLVGILEVLDGTLVVKNVTLSGTRPAIAVAGVTGGSPHVTVHGVYATGAIFAGVVVNTNGVLDGDRLVVRDTVPLIADVPSLMLLRGQLGEGMDVGSGAQVTLRQAIFERTYAAGVGVAAAATRVRLEDSAIRDTRPQQSDGLLGTGVVHQSGTVELVRTHLSNNTTAAVFLYTAAARMTLQDVVMESQVADPTGFGGGGIVTLGGVVTGDRVLVRDSVTWGLQPASTSRIDLRDLIVADTALDDEGQWGTGAYLDGPVNMTLTRALFTGNHTAGILTESSGVTATDLTIRGTRSDVDGEGGTGLITTMASGLTLTRAIFEDNQSIGLGVNGGTATLTDVASIATIPRTSGGGNGIQVGGGATVTADRILSDGNTQVAIGVTEADTTLDARDVVGRDTQLSVDGARGIGLFVTSGARATIERSLWQRNRWVNVVTSGGTITLTDAVVEDTLPTADDTIGEGVGSSAGGLVQITRGIVRRNRRSGMYAFGEGSRLELTDVLVADTDSEIASGLTGLGVVIQLGATGSLSRVLFDHNRHIGLAVGGAGTVVTAADVVVRDTQPVAVDMLSGRGVNLQAGADLTIERVAISGCRDTGFAVFGPNTRLDLSDLSVADMGSVAASGIGGWGLTGSGVTGAVRRVRVERARASGVLIADDADLTFEDVTVLDTQPVEVDDTVGRGINVQNGAHVTFTRALVSGSHELAVFVDSAGTEATFEAIEVRDTMSAANSLAYGGGLWAQLGAHVTVRNGLFASNRYAGVSAVGADDRIPDVTLEDIVVYGTAESECVGTSDGCPRVSGGMGIGSYGVGAVRATRFRVLANALCGVQVAGEAELDLTDGVVAGNPIGACVQRADYDFGRLSAGVTYRNDINVDSTTLPVPSAASSLADLPTADDR